MSCTFKDNHDFRINPSFNDLLTKYSNDRGGWYPTKTERKFLKACYDINVIRDESFCRLDFGDFEPKFRQYVWKLGDIFEKIIEGRPPFYKLKGITINSHTIRDTGVRKVSGDFEKILLRLRHQPPYIHDIKISTPTKGLYEGLFNNNHIPTKQNLQIILKDFPIKSKFTPTVIVSRTGNLSIHLGCTYNPVPYSIAGFDGLIEYLSNIDYILTLRSGKRFLVAPIHKWIITYFHFNKDGIVIDSPIHHHSISDLQEHSQIYLKPFPNGKKALRWEKKITPNTTIEEEQTQAAIDQAKYLSLLDNAKELYDV